MTGENVKNPEKVLIVDDLEINVEILESIIRSEGYEPLCALNVNEALEMMNRVMPQLILSDYSMPDMDGVEFCRLLKKNPKTRDIPFILITVADSSEVKRAAFEAGAADYIPKPFERMEVVMRINHQINTYRAKQEVIEHNRRMHRVIEEQHAMMDREQENLLKVLAKIAERLDVELGEHLERVGYNCRVLAQSLQLTERYEDEVNDDFVEIIATASKLHDIGIFMVSDKVAPDGGMSRKLDNEEYIKLHTEEGAKLLEELVSGLSKSRFLDMALDIVKYHHARWDGTGYPNDKNENDIPLAARIVAVINDFEFYLRTKEGDVPAVENAVSAICDRSGTFYDPGIVKVFSKITKQLRLPL